MRLSGIITTWVLFVAVLIGWRWIQSARRITSHIPTIVTASPTSKPIERLNCHLDWAEEASQQLIAEHLRFLDEFFAAAKHNSAAFADEILSWSSKMRLITDHLPWIGTDRAQERYLATSFAKHVFAKEDLERALTRVVNQFLKDVDGIEGQLLVKIRQDASLPVEVVLQHQDKAELAAWFREKIKHSCQATGRALEREAVQVLVSTVVTEALLVAARRMGVSAGIYSVAGATSHLSFGTTLVLGLIVDQLVSWAWDRIADPRGQLVDRLQKWLDELHTSLVDGGGTSSGLRRHLRELLRERSQARRTVLDQLLQEEGAAS